MKAAWSRTDRPGRSSPMKASDRRQARAPILTRLFQRLNGDVPSANGIPVTVDEAADLIKTRLRPRQNSPGPRDAARAPGPRGSACRPYPLS